jgi:hypothetical protein
MDRNCHTPTGSSARGGAVDTSSWAAPSCTSSRDAASESGGRTGDYSDSGEQREIGSMNENPLMIGLGRLLPALRDAANTNSHAEPGSSGTNRAPTGECASSESNEVLVDEDEEDSFSSVNSSLNSSHGSCSAIAAPDTNTSAAARSSPFATAASDESGQGKDGMQASDEPKVVPYNPSLLNPKWASSKDRLNKDEENAATDHKEQEHHHTGLHLYPQLPCGRGCYSIPDMATLQAMTDAEKSCVTDLIIGKEGYGEVQWRDQLNGVDLGAGVDLSGAFVLRDNMVRWEGKVGRCTGVELWPGCDDKPPIGVGLNRAAVVTLNFRKNFRRSQMARDVHAGGMSFVDYEPQSGRLQFVVDHF